MSNLYSLLLILFFVLAGSDGKAQSAPDKNVLRIEPGVRSAPWSPSRLRQAAPMPLPQVDPGALEAFEKKSGERMTPPEAELHERSGAAEVPAKKLRADRRQYPLVWAGKLFFSSADGRDFACSAQFVSPTVILTAAHCVQDRKTKKWYRNFEFKLQYNRGRQRRTYTTVCVATYPDWITAEAPENYVWDYAMMRVRGQSVSGHFGWKSNWPRTAYGSVVVIGYPRGIGRGEVIQELSIPILRFLASKSEPQAGVLEARHGDRPFTKGASGGAWVGDYRHNPRGPNNNVLSVVSFGIKNRPGVMYGPYWNAKFQELLNYVDRGCS